MLPIGDSVDRISLLSSFLLEVITVVRKIGITIVLMAMAGMASASGPGASTSCIQILWFDLFCWSTPTPTPVKAPEIDPASAIAGLTMLGAGLAVLRGRRRKNTKE